MSERHTPAQDYLREHLHDVTDECMIWPFAVDTAGYGQVHIDGRHYRVHALACETHNGPRPPGMVAAHGPCHNPLCFNGRHLSWRTKKQNSADMRRDGTHRCGEVMPTAKLTENDVRDIRQRYAAGGVLQRELAAEFGVHEGTISRALRGHLWGHVGATT